MSGPPPAYSAIDNGEGNNAPPPSYDASAPKAPPSYNPAAPVAAPVQQTVTPNIKYVDQNGNPVAPPTQGANIKYVDQNGNPINVAQQPIVQQKPAIKYVDQNGNPVAPPVAAGNIKYVDQYGNPVAPPTAQPVVQQPAVKYVDQYGNPVAPPTAQPVVQQPAVKYVDQYGNPVAPPTGTAAVTPKAVSPAGAQSHQSRAENSQKAAAAVLGGLAALIMIIGLIVNNLASDTDFNSTTTCTWTEVTNDCDDSYSFYSYSSCTDYAFSYDDLCTLSSYSSSSYVGGTYCGTQTAAALCLVCTLISIVVLIIAIIYGQPWCKVEPCACKTNPQWSCARACFSTSIFFSVLAVIIWVAGDEVCYGGIQGLNMGGTIVCIIIGIVFSFISCLVAK